MALSSVYRKYFQKSQVFIYPLLGIQRGAMIIPKSTHLSWNDNVALEDMKLVCVYEIENQEKFDNFSKAVLLKHPRLCGYVKTDNKTSVFTFDFSDMEENWCHFINGKYSKISMNLKRKILDFFDKSSGNYAYVNSYLFPEKHFDEYAELLNHPVEVLKEVGELCSKPNFEKENLILDVADLGNISETTLNLQNNEKI